MNPTSDRSVPLRSATINDHPMAYIEHGSGAPVVLVHGSLSDYRVFVDAVHRLSARHRVIAVSLRHYYPERWDGQGGRFSMRQHVDDTAAFIQTVLAGEPVHLVGHSRGGSLALYPARDYPALVRTIVVAEGGSNMPVFESADPSSGIESQRALARFKATVALLEAGRTDEALQYFVDDVGGAGRWAGMPEAERQMRRDNAWTVKGQLADVFEPFTEHDAQRIACPTLVMGGAKSPAFFTPMLDAMQRLLPRAERASLANSSHGMPTQQPAAFSAAILDFIARHDSVAT